MNTRPLTKGEASNLAALNNAGLDSGLIFLTATGLKKSILDATQPIRELLLAAEVHDYANQCQGENSKIKLPCAIYDSGIRNNTEVSLYRPNTKKGDPRLWPYRLSQFASADNVLAIFIVNGVIQLINLSDHNSVLLGEETDLSLLLQKNALDYNRSSDELLFKLRELAATGPLRSVCDGSTAIGRTIETRLGIAINSSPFPDYKGIEIKSGRSNSSVRSNLFAQVADWDLSHFKSSREIVEAIGYDVPEAQCRKLYCTVSARKPNSRGLFFDLDLERGRLDELIEKADGNSPVCVWRLKRLHDKLQKKHRETFWVKAKQISIDGAVHFHLETIKHTRRPSIVQFDRLLGNGEITMDHLIKQTQKKVNEKGPLFKINSGAIEELFLGKTREYNLTV